MSASGYRFLIIVACTALLVLPVLVPHATAQSKVEHGKYLVEGIAGCGNCHTAWIGPMKGRPLAGGNLFGDDKAPFKAFAPNITMDAETGIGNWTDDQIVAAIREGRRPDGSVIGPPMAIEFYNGMSDADVRAIVAYLRTVPPIRHEVPKSVYRIPLRAAGPAGHVASAPKDDKIGYGAYLARIGHCMECHTPMEKGRPVMSKLGAGGTLFEGPWGESVSANITQDKETGIGKWTDAQIRTAVAHGKRPDGAGLRPPMCYDCYANMTDADLDAVVAYLRTVKPVKTEPR